VIQPNPRSAQLRQPPVVECAEATIVTSHAQMIAQANTRIVDLAQVVATHFGQRRDAEIYSSQPSDLRSGLGGARARGPRSADPGEGQVPGRGLAACLGDAASWSW
jgi:hypothetical protein